MLAGCGEDRPHRATTTDGGGSVGLSVELVPPQPTAADDIRVLIRGKVAKVSIGWFINDEPVEGEGSDVLKSGAFKKGDRVAALVVAEGAKVTVETVVANSPPELVSLKVVPDVVHRGVDIRAEPEATDIDGDEVEYIYRWFINGQEVMEQVGHTLSGTLIRRGDRVSVEVTPYDGESYGKGLSYGDIKVVNAPPRFVSTPPEAIEGGLYSYSPEVEDPDGDETTIRLDEAPEGMTLTGGTIRWNLKGVKPGTYRVRIVAEDGYDGVATQEYSIRLFYR